jgi:hypothetical protein
MLEFKPEDETPFPHKEITEAIIGSAFEVYEPSWSRFSPVVVGEYDGDVTVNDAVLVEIQIAPQYDKRDEAQLLNVLKATGLKVGILLNFGRYKVEYKRLIF